MSEKEAILRLEGVSKSFAGIPVLQTIDCTFFAGEVHCLLGENGAGKSTLIKTISGAHAPTAGRVMFCGQDITGHSPAWAKDNGIATIYQELDLIPNLGAAENISLGSEPRSRWFGQIDRKRVRQVANDTLKSMGLSLDVDTPVQTLGIAQQQMVAIAKALTRNNRMIILDEPTAVFTKNEKDTLFRLVRELKARGMAVVFISHHMDEIFEIGDRITVLRDGKVASTGPVSDYDHDKAVRSMVGRSVENRRQQRTSAIGEPVLEVRGLTSGKRVRDVSFELRAGEIVGVAGLVGSGRTRMARLVYGAERASSGEIRLHGQLVDPRSPTDMIRRGVGMVPEDRKRDGLALERSAGENLGLVKVQALSRFGWVPWSRIRGLVDTQMQRLQVKPNNPSIQALRMSGGNQQKLVLGRWLMQNPRLLILDEPTRGVDVGARAEIYALLQKLRDEGVAILMISSDLPEILSQADRILVMAKGRIVGELDGKSATEEAIIALAFRTEVEAA
ncbi:MAG: Ribose import ATP-binding protein RbsA [Rhizobium sp.]|nr:Ribose import ATP-binding protein RbsA [Rhizobium sp.]